MKKLAGEYAAKTVKEAVEIAAAELGVEAETLNYEVLEEGKKGLFGIGASDAKIAVYVEDQKSDGERAVEFLEGLMKLLKVDASPVLVKEEEKIEIALNAKKTHDVIGKHGATLDAIQSLAGAIANIGRDDYKRVVVDCENYREKREETLKHVAQKTAEKAVRQGRKIALEPMSAYERRIIHAALSDSTEVKTTSEGKEPRRFVVVIPNELKPYNRDERRNRGGKGGRDRRDGKGGYGRDRKSFDKPRREYSEEEKARRSQVGGGTGFAAKGDYSYKKTSSVVFGTFLGNSRDNAETVEIVETVEITSEE